MPSASASPDAGSKSTTTKKTTYDVDLTVQGVPPSTLADIGRAAAAAAAATGNGAAAADVAAALLRSPAPLPGAPAAAGSKAASPAKAPEASPKAQDPPKPKQEEPKDKQKDDKKDKKDKDKKKKSKKKKDASSSSSSSSSGSSSSDSDDDPRKSWGVRHALEPWRYPLYCPTASYRQLDTMTGSHQYVISGFSLARAMGCGTRLCSDLFEVAGQLFRLEVYPAGFTADARKYMSVFLTTPGSLNPNHVFFEVAVLDQSGKDKHIVATSSDGGRHHHHFPHFGPTLVSAHGIVGALLRLCKTKQLQEKHKRYLPHDTCVLRATVHVLRGWSSIPTIHGHTASTLMHSHTGMGGTNMLLGSGTGSSYGSSLYNSHTAGIAAAAAATHGAPMASIVHTQQQGGLAMPGQGLYSTGVVTQAPTYTTAATAAPHTQWAVQAPPAQHTYAPAGYMRPPPVPQATYVAPANVSSNPAVLASPMMATVLYNPATYSVAPVAAQH